VITLQELLNHCVATRGYFTSYLKIIVLPLMITLQE